MSKTPSGELLTRRELAAAMNVGMQTVTKWERSGLPVYTRGRKGMPSIYRLEDVKAWLEAREEHAKAPGAPMDLARERAIKEKWQGKLARQQFEVREKLLIPSEDFRAMLLAEQTAIRTKLLAVPVQYADKVARAVTLLGVAGAEATLKEMIFDVLRELADPEREPKPTPPEDDGETGDGEADAA